jgi:hypothetical protein
MNNNNYVAQNQNSNFNNPYVNYNQPYAPPSQYVHPQVQPQNTYMPPNTYQAQPAYVYTTSGTIPPLVNNQVYSTEILMLQKALKSNATFVICPNCKNQGISRADQSCSGANVLCCICFGGIFWLLFQAVRGKDINCYDTRHTCMKCGIILGDYTAC